MTNEWWEEEIEKIYGITPKTEALADNSDRDDCIFCGGPLRIGERLQGVKDKTGELIAEAQRRERARLREMVRGMGDNGGSSYEAGWDDALNSILKLLEEK